MLPCCRAEKVCYTHHKHRLYLSLKCRYLEAQVALWNILSNCECSRSVVGRIKRLMIIVSFCTSFELLFS